MVLKLEELDDLYLSFLNDRELTKKDIGNLFLKSYDKRNYILGRKYNVEYKLGNGIICTFSNILENVDGKYFWFCSEKDGLCVILQDRICTMVCTDNDKTLERIDNTYKNNLKQIKEALLDIGIDIRKNKDELKSLSEIFEEISTKWDELSTEENKYLNKWICMSIAGIKDENYLRVLIDKMRKENN